MRFYVLLLGVVYFSSATIKLSAQSLSVELYWNMQSASGANLNNAALQVGELIPGNNFGNTVFFSNQVVSGGYTGASGENNASLAARTGPLQKSLQGSAYIEFTIIPSAGYRLSITGISFGIRSTATGPRQWNLFHSDDQYFSPLAEGTIENNSTWSLVTVSGLQISTTKSVTIRLYGFGGQGIAAINVANWRIDDLRVLGNLVPDDLPVTWRYHKAFEVSEGVLLQWGTGNELNNEGFQIERSEDGHIFFPVGFVKAARNAGLANSENDYEFTDHFSATGFSFYRIVQRDIDGTLHASPILFLKRSSSPTTSRLSILSYDKGVLTVSLRNHEPQLWHMQIFNLRGSLLQTITTAKSNGLIRASVGVLLPGVYTVVIADLYAGRKYASGTFGVSH